MEVEQKSKESVAPFDLKEISFPSNITVTYQKMKDTVQKFVELGGGPFTQEQIEEKMSDLGNIKMVKSRVIPFLHNLGFTERSRIGERGKITYKLKPEIRERIDRNPAEFDSVLIELASKSASYLVIWNYAKEEKANKFLVSTFEQQYLRSKLNLKFSKTGLNSWLNALSKVNLIKLDGGLISLEGITPPSAKPPPEKHEEKPFEGPPPEGEEGFAPGMTFNVNVDLDYRQPPDLQREIMRWLERMSSRPNVMTIRERKEEEKKSKSERETGRG